MSTTNNTNAMGRFMKGNELALGAISEVLNKMNARLEKQAEEEDEEELSLAVKKADDDAAKEKNALEEEITKQVVSRLSKEFDGLLDMHADEEQKARGNTAWPMSSNPAGEDAEDPASPRSSTEEVQKPIQASAVGAVAKMPNGELAAPPVIDDEGADEFPMEEDEFEEHPDAPLANQIKSLKKQILDLRNGMSQQVTSEAESRLRKMGFREESGLKGVRPSTLGTDGVAIVKSTPDKDVPDQLADLSWKELRNMQVNVEAGNTTGVPKELIQG